jgi:hypothetical protein
MARPLTVQTVHELEVRSHRIESHQGRPEPYREREMISPEIDPPTLLSTTFHEAKNGLEKMITITIGTVQIRGDSRFTTSEMSGTGVEYRMPT